MSKKKRISRILAIFLAASMVLSYNSSFYLSVWAAGEETPAAEEEMIADPAPEEESADSDETGEETSAAEEEMITDTAPEDGGEVSEEAGETAQKTDQDESSQQKEAGASEESEVIPEAETEAEEEAPAERPEKDKYTYEDGRIKVTAVLDDASAIPDDAKLVVTPVTKDSDGYNYDAYMEALNKEGGSEAVSEGNKGIFSKLFGRDKEEKSDVYTEDNTLLYDIAFIIDKNGKKVEVQPEEGKVSVKAEFLNDQLTEDIGAEKAGDVTLIHLPLSDEAADSVDTTAAATDIKATDITVEKVDADVTVGKNQEAAFKTDSLSVWAFADGTGGMTVPAPSPEKFEDSTKYNLLGGDFGILSNFGLVSFDTLTLNQHACSNFAAENVVLKGKAYGVGTNKKDGIKSPEVSYIGSSIANDGLAEHFAVNLEGESILVLGKDIPAGTVDKGSKEQTWNCTIGGIPTAISHAEKYEEKSGEKVSASVFQEGDTKYIDLPALKTKAEDLSTTFAGYETSNVIKKEDVSFLHYDETKNTTVAALNLKASELSKPLKLEDANANKSHVLIINIDAEGAEKIEFPGLKWVGADGNAQPGTWGEVSVWTEGNVIINVTDSKKDNKRFTGTFYNNDQTTAVILAPDATVIAKKNINGQVFANNITIEGDGEFHRDSFTFKSSITVRGGIKARKTVNGSSDLSNVTQRFSFQLTAIEGKDLKGNIIPKANMPMPDNATAAEKESKSMIADSDMKGVINFGFIDFKGVEGDYTFSVKEIIPEGAAETEGGKYSNGYIYDTNEYTVTIKGRRTAEGGIGIEGYDISKNSGAPEYVDYDTGKQNGIVTFSNREAGKKASIKVTKAFNGEWPEEGFTFKLTGVTVEENGVPRNWQDYDPMPAEENNYAQGESKIITVTKDSPVAEFGVLGINPGENKKYFLQIEEIVTNPIDGVVYDNKKHTVVIEPKKIGNDTVTLATYDGDKSNLTITNIEVGDLVIKKTFDGLNVTDEEKAGGLTFEVKTPDGKWLDKDGKVSNTPVTLTLAAFTKDEKSGEYVKTFENVAAGKYTVTETNTTIAGYKFDSEASDTTAEATVSKTADGVAEIKDVYEKEEAPAETGKLVIKKSVGGDVTKEEFEEGAISFVVSTKVTEDGKEVTKYLKSDGTLSENEADGTYVIGKAGDGFETTDGGKTYTKTFNKVPAGSYTVNEKNSAVEGYDLVAKQSDTGEKTAAVAKDGTATAEFKDVYEKTEEPVTEKKGDFVITKTVGGNVTEEEIEKAALKFEVKTSDGKWLDKDGKVSDTKVELTLGEADGFVTTDGGKTWTKTLKDVAPGKYTVTETNSLIDGYTLKKDGTNTVATADVTDGGKATAELTDEYEKNETPVSAKTGDLIITKTIEGKVTKEDIEKAGIKFEIRTSDGKWLDKDGKVSDKKVELTLGEEDGFITTDGGKTWTKVLRNVPVDTYTVSETYSVIDGYDVTVVTKTSTAEVKEGEKAEAELAGVYEKDEESVVDEEEDEENEESAADDDKKDKDDKKPSKGINTGDDAPFTAWLTLMLASIVGLVASVFNRRRSDRK